MQRTAKFMLMSLILPVLRLPFAQAMDTPKKEIQHLFEFISHSDCISIHNISEYPAKKARDHMQTRYNYAKRWVESAEQLIEHMASKSSVSGARYQVRYQRRLSYSDNLLEQELTRNRTNHATGH